MKLEIERKQATLEKNGQSPSQLNSLGTRNSKNSTKIQITTDETECKTVRDETPQTQSPQTQLPQTQSVNSSYQTFYDVENRSKNEKEKK